MSVKGEIRENTATEKKFYVGLTSVEVAAVNPTRAQLNKLLGKEPEDTDEEISYVGEDKEANPRVRLSFWLRDNKNDKYFVLSFNVTKKIRTSKDTFKVQLINNTLDTTWVPFIKDGDEVTDVPDESLLPAWFTQFIEKETKDVLGDKTWRKALLGEEELAKLLRAWLTGLNFKNPNADVVIDVDTLLKEDFSELQGLIGGDYDKSFIVLTGVKTDENDPAKKYQQVYGKSFLPNGTLSALEKNFKGSSDYIKKAWAKFEEEVTGEYGFDGYTELVPLKEYDPTQDIADSNDTKADVTPKNSKF